MEFTEHEYERQRFANELAEKESIIAELAELNDLLVEENKRLKAELAKKTSTVFNSIGDNCTHIENVGMLNL